MDAPQSHTLSKEERLCGKTTVAALISSGKWGSTPHLRFCWSAGHDTGLNRLMVSVPKKFFKRAVKRNLLKRRVREAFRLQKGRLGDKSYDIFIYYVGKEVEEYERIEKSVAQVLDDLAAC